MQNSNNGIILKVEILVYWHRYRPHFFKSVWQMLIYFPLTLELWRIKESRSTELISSKSSTPSVSPDREERFSQFPEDTKMLPTETGSNYQLRKATTVGELMHAGSGAGERKHSTTSFTVLKPKSKKHKSKRCSYQMEGAQSTVLREISWPSSCSNLSTKCLIIN